MKWNFSKSIIENEPYFIQNINIWDKEWVNTDEKLKVSINNKIYSFPIFEIEENGLKVKFSATEISNNIWNIYEQKSENIKVKKSLYIKIRSIGLFTIFLSIGMFIYSISMFTSRGQFSKFTIKLSEFCFLLWLPFLIIGFLIFLTSILFKRTNQ
jgi:hypothetical protein